jgi:hypothetical protein
LPELLNRRIGNDPTNESGVIKCYAKLKKRVEAGGALPSKQVRKQQPKAKRKHARQKSDSLRKSLSCDAYDPGLNA